MAEAFITVLNGVITGKHHGDMDADFWGTPYFGHERKVIPFDALANISPIEPLEFYTSSWERKSNAVLIKEGLLPLPNGHALKDGELRPMTEVELFEAGLIERSGFKVLDGEFAPMTLQEQLRAKLITPEQFEATKIVDNTAELDRRLAELQTPTTLAKAEIDAAYAMERKAKIMALLKVEKQKGWPLEVNWPQ